MGTALVSWITTGHRLYDDDARGALLPTRDDHVVAGSQVSVPSGPSTKIVDHVGCRALVRLLAIGEEPFLVVAGVDTPS